MGNAKGFGFCQVDGDEDSEDIFIPADQTNGAIDGDGVIVRVFSQGADGYDGRVVKLG